MSIITEGGSKNTDILDTKNVIMEDLGENEYKCFYIVKVVLLRIIF